MTHKIGIANLGTWNTDRVRVRRISKDTLDASVTDGSIMDASGGEVLDRGDMTLVGASPGTVLVIHFENDEEAAPGYQGELYLKISER